MSRLLQLATLGAATVLATKTDGRGELITVEIPAPDPQAARRAREADEAAIAARMTRLSRKDRPGNNTPVSGGGARERARRQAQMAKQRASRSDLSPTPQGEG